MQGKKTDDQALRPNFSFSALPTLMVEDQKAEKKGASEEERQLYAMSQTGGWRILKEHINNLVEELEQVNRSAIEQGLGFETIGQNTVIINTTKGVIEGLLNKVEDAIEVCTEINE